MRKFCFILTGALAASNPGVGAAPAAFALEAARSPQKALRRIPLRLANGKWISVDLADTPRKRERGLMFRRKLPGDYGMLFVFPEPMGLQFWMKNTWVSLDIVFIGRDKRITRVHRRVKPSTEKTADSEVARVGGFGQYVLELPAGTAARERLEEGQALDFELAIPRR